MKYYIILNVSARIGYSSMNNKDVKRKNNANSWQIENFLIRDSLNKFFFPLIIRLF